MNCLIQIFVVCSVVAVVVRGQTLIPIATTFAGITLTTDAGTATVGKVFDADNTSCSAASGTPVLQVTLPSTALFSVLFTVSSSAGTTDITTMTANWGAATCTFSPALVATVFVYTLNCGTAVDTIFKLNNAAGKTLNVCSLFFFSLDPTTTTTTSTSTTKGPTTVAKSAKYARSDLTIMVAMLLATLKLTMDQYAR